MRDPYCEHGESATRLDVDLKQSENDRLSTDWISLSECLSAKLELFGLDVVAPLALDWYNSCLPHGTPAQLPASGEAGSQALTLLVGNTKHIWEPFLSACTEHPQLLDLADPLDAYVERSVEAVLQDTFPTASCRVFYGHRKSQSLLGGDGGSSGYVALQRMAQAGGIAYLDEESHLCMHPKYGPWFALRACLVFDDIIHSGKRPKLLNSPLDSTTRHYIRLAIKSANRSSCDLTSVLSDDLSQAVSRSSSQTACQTHSRPAVLEREVGTPPQSPASAAAPDVGQSLRRLRQSQHQLDAESATGASASGDGHYNHHISAVHCRSDSSQGVAAGNIWPMLAPSTASVRAQWRKWVAIRDAPCAGHPWRYPNHQLTYHYTGDLNMLRRLLSVASLPPDASERRTVEAEISLSTARRRRSGLYSRSSDQLSASCHNDRCSAADDSHHALVERSSASSSSKASCPLQQQQQQSQSPAASSPQHGCDDSGRSDGLRVSSSSPSLRGPYHRQPGAPQARTSAVEPHTLPHWRPISVDYASPEPHCTSMSARTGSSTGHADSPDNASSTSPYGLAVRSPRNFGNGYSSPNGRRSTASSPQRGSCRDSSRTHMHRKSSSRLLLEASPQCSDDEDSQPYLTSFHPQATRTRPAV